MTETNTNIQTPPTPGAPTQQPAQTPKFEVKEGKYLIDGHSYVKESDLIAAKESLSKQLTEAQSVHVAAIDKANLSVSDLQHQLAEANAKLTTSVQARDTSATTAASANVAKLQADFDSAKAELTKVQTQTLDYRKKYLISVGVPKDKVDNKSSTELEALETALSVVAAATGSRGLGNYAVLGGGNGSAQAPLNPFDRAKQLLANTPIRGVRNDQK